MLNCIHSSSSLSSQVTTHTSRSNLGTHSSHYGTMDSIKKDPSSSEPSVSYRKRTTPNTNPQKTHIDLNGVLLEGDSSDSSDLDMSIN